MVEGPRGGTLSEQVVEETEEVEESEEETEETETEQGEKPADDVIKLRKALGRERNAKKKALADLAQLRKEAQQGDPNQGEMEKLTAQVKLMQQSIAEKDHVTSLLEAGFNGTAAQAGRMIRLVDNFDDEEWLDELKTDFPERFGKQSRRSDDGRRPFTGGGRDETRGTKKSVDEVFVDKLMGRSRRT